MLSVVVLASRDSWKYGMLFEAFDDVWSALVLSSWKRVMENITQRKGGNMSSVIDTDRWTAGIRCVASRHGHAELRVHVCGPKVSIMVTLHDAETRPWFGPPKVGVFQRSIPDRQTRYCMDASVTPMARRSTQLRTAMSLDTLQQWVQGQLAKCDCEKDELKLFQHLMDSGLTLAALRAVHATDDYARVASRSYNEDGFLLRVVLLDGNGFQLRLHRWLGLSPEETLWHSHQYPMVVQCLAGRGYTQEVGRAFRSDAGAWRGYGRRPGPDGGFQVSPLPGPVYFALKRATSEIRPGLTYALTTSDLHVIKGVDSDGTITAVMRGRQYEHNPLFLLRNGDPTDMIQRRRTPLTTSTIRHVVCEALGRARPFESKLDRVDTGVGHVLT
jgi:hypothetical protein